MKQSNNNKKSRDVTAFLYERLSRDDNMDGESYSIGNQKKLLIKVAKEKGYTNLVHFFDDGISGVTMDRPDRRRRPRNCGQDSQMLSPRTRSYGFSRGQFLQSFCQIRFRYEKTGCNHGHPEKRF